MHAVSQVMLQTHGECVADCSHRLLLLLRLLPKLLPKLLLLRLLRLLLPLLLLCAPISSCDGRGT